MNRTLVFASVGALATALLVAMLLSAAMGKKSKEPVNEILVATKDLPIGTSLNSSNAHWQKWPSGASVPGALYHGKVKDEDWKDQKIRRALTEDEPITEGSLVRQIKGSYLAAALEPGMRAVTMDVKAASSVAGFVAPGDRVDVILTYSVRVNADTSQHQLQELVVEKASETILQNLRVLATDQDSTGGNSGERKAKISKTVTLEVTKEGAEKLALASQIGEVSLAMRQLGDTKIDETLDHPVTDVTTGKILKKAIDLRNKSDSPTGGVRVYTNNGVQVVPVVQSPATSEAR